MDFFQAHQLLWACRQSRPIEAQHADLLSYLLLRCYAQGRLDTLTCTAPLEELVKALRQSERNARRQRSYLRERGYLALSDQHHEVQLTLEALATELALPAQELPAPPLRQLPARSLPRPLGSSTGFVSAEFEGKIEVEPLHYPSPGVLVLKEAVPSKKLRAAAARTVASVLEAQGATVPVVNGSGVKLHYEESCQVATALQLTDHAKFELWLQQEAPKVLRFKNPITPHQLTDLYRKFDPKLIATKLRAIDNKTGAERKYDSAYQTLVNWCKLGNFGRELDAHDEFPLPACRVLEEEKRNRPGEVGSLFAQPGNIPAVPEYIEAKQAADARNDKFNWDN